MCVYEILPPNLIMINYYNPTLKRGYKHRAMDSIDY